MQDPILLITASHGVPATRVRPERGEELARALRDAGIGVDWFVVLERPCELPETERFRRPGPLRPEVLPDPWSLHPVGRLFRRLLARAGRPVPPPLGLMRRIRSRLSVSPRAKIVLSGPRVLEWIPHFEGFADVIADVPCSWGRVLASARSLGRLDLLDLSPAAIRRLQAAEQAYSRARILILSCEEDARDFRKCEGPPICIVPPLAYGFEPRADRPVRPPRILFAGSETVANLDGMRWFRDRVLPRVLRSVPSVRLRVVGEIARHLTPDPRLERLGWVEDLALEYARATAVILPLRIGGRLHRRAVEALSAGKALVVTPQAAWGLGGPQEGHFIAASGTESFAGALVRVLTDESGRRRLEDRALQWAARFRPERAVAGLLELLGADSSPPAVCATGPGIPSCVDRKSRFPRGSRDSAGTR